MPTYLIAVRSPAPTAGETGSVLVHLARAPSELEAIDLVMAQLPEGYSQATSLGPAPTTLIEELRLPPGDTALVQALG